VNSVVGTQVYGVKVYGVRGALSDPPGLGEWMVVVVVDHEKAVADARTTEVEQCIAALRESREQLTRPPLADNKRHLLAGIDHAIVVLEDHLTYGGAS
jgi:hypothetical protein